MTIYPGINGQDRNISGLSSYLAPGASIEECIKAGRVWVLQSGLPFSVCTSAAFEPVYNSSGQVIGNSGGDYNSVGSKISGPSMQEYLHKVLSAAASPAPSLGEEGNLGRNTYN